MPAPLLLVLGQRGAFSGAVVCASVLADEPMPVENADTILRLVHGDFTVDEGGRQGAPIVVERDVAFEIDAAPMQGVHLGHVRRQLLQG